MAVPRNAATILVLCQPVASTAFKVLMIKRHSKARFMANVYVFPGGCVDEADTKVAQDNLPADITLPSYRAAATRELLEETSLLLNEDGSVSTAANDSKPNVAPSKAFVPYAHWVTPKQEKYRYDTRFFLHKVQPEAISLQLKPDPKEVADIRWVTPDEAIELHSTANSNFRLPPPTFLLMHHLSTFENVDDLVAKYSQLYQLRVDDMPRVEPVIDLSKKPHHVYMEKDWCHLPPGTMDMGATVMHIGKGLPEMPPYKETSKL